MIQARTLARAAILALLVTVGCQCGDEVALSPDVARATVTVDRSQGVVADGVDAAAVTVTIVDQHGKPMAGVDVDVASTGESNQLSEPKPTDATGHSTSKLTSTRAETKTIAVSVRIGSKLVELTTHPTVQFVHGPAAKVAFTIPPSATQAGATITPAVQVAVQDAYGNLVGDSTAEVALALKSRPDGAVLGGTARQAAVGGSATFTDLVLDVAGQGYTLEATSAGLEAAVSGAFDVSVGAPAKLSFLVQPTETVAGVAIAPALQVRVEDAEGNKVPGSTAPISIAIAENANAATLGGTRTVAAVDGVATFADLTVDKAGEGYLLAVTSPTFAGTTSGAFAVRPAAPSADRSAITATPAQVTADGTAASELALQVRDAFGNGVPGVEVALSASGTGNTLTPEKVTTDEKGEAKVSLTSTVAEVKKITAQVGELFALETSVTFVPGAPDAATSAFVASPTTVVADGVLTTTLTVVLKDAHGNLVPNAQVALATSGTANTLTPETGASDATGSFEATLSSTKAEIKHVTATIADFTLEADVTFAPGAPTSVTSSVAAESASITADGTSTTTVTVTALDAYENPVPGVAVTFSSTGTRNTFDPASGEVTTDAQGHASVALASTKAEEKQVTVSLGDFALQTSVTFTPGVPSAPTSHLAAQPVSIVADGQATTALSVVVLDAQTNPVPNVEVAFVSTGSDNTFSPVSAVTSSDGVATVALASTRAEGKTITASVGGLFDLSTAVTFTPGAPARATSSLSVGADTVVADGSATTTLSVVVKDAFGNLVPDAQVSLNVGGTANTLSPASGTTDGSGRFSATLASTKAEAKTITATIGGFTLTASTLFVPGTPVAANSTILAAPASVVADGTAAGTLTVTLRDAYGNLVPNASVSLASSGTSNTFAPASGSTNGAGVFTSSLVSTKAEAKTVTATISGFTLTASVTFVAGTPVASNSTISASPASVVADGAAASTVTVTLRDAYGNLVPSASVSFASSGTSNTFTPATGSTNASGVFTSALKSTKAEAKTITATIGGFTLTASVTFVAGTPVAANSTIAASPTSVVADGTSASAITLTLRDANGNLVPSAAVSLSSSGTSNTFTPASGATNASGVFTSLLVSTKAEAKTITATIGGFTLTANVTFVAGAPVAANSAIAASPASVVADGAAASTVTVTLRDTYGNLVPSAIVSLASSGTSNTFTPATGSTNGAGVFTSSLVSTKAEAKTVTATIGSFTLTASVTFVAGAPVAANSTIAASPTSVVADGASASTFTLTLRDANGNLVPNAGVSLSSSGTSNTFTPASGTTNSAGVFTATLKSTKAEVKTVTATIGGFSLTANVTFVAGAPVAANSTISASPASVVADGAAASSVAVTLRDANGNLVPSAAVSLASSGTSNTFTPATGSTNASGVFTSSFVSTKAEAKTITATISGFTLTASVTFVAGAPVAANSAISASPTSVVADGSAASTVTVTLRDANGNLVPSASVTLASSGTSNTFTPASGATNASGVFTSSLVSTKAEAKTITATIGGFTLTASVTFVAGAPVAANSTISAAPTSVVADGAAASTLTVTLRDAYGNLVPNASVSLSSSGTSNTFTPATGSTNTSGVFTSSFVSTKAEAKTVTATIGGFTLTASVTFVASAPVAANSTISASPTSVVADGAAASTVTVTLRDANGNLVPSAAVSLASSGTSNTFTPATGTTNGSGVFTSSFVSTKAEVKTISATIGGFTLTASVTFVAGAPVTSNSTISASPTSVVADGTAASTVTVTLRDANGNLVPSASVTLASSGTSNTFNPATGTTNGAGVFTSSFVSTKAEAKTVTATSGSASVSTSVSFLAGAPSSSRSSLSISPDPVIVGSNTTILVTVRDANSNVISGQGVSLSVSGTTNTVSPGSGSSNSSGQFSATLASTRAEAKTVTATVGSFTLSGTVTFNPGAVSATQSSVSASPTTVPADNTSSATILVTARDGYGNPVPSQAVTLSRTGVGTLTQPASATNGSGQTSGSIRSGSAGTATIVAVASGVTLSDQPVVTFDPGNGRVIDVYGNSSPVMFVPCGNGSVTNCTQPVAETSCTNIGKKLVSHASDGTASVVSLGATSSCQWSISYFTNLSSALAGQCLIGVSNASWSSCCTWSNWHGNTVVFPAAGQQFGFVNSGNSGYNASLVNSSGSTWGCIPTGSAPPSYSSCTTYYVACK